LDNVSGDCAKRARSPSALRPSGRYTRNFMRRFSHRSGGGSFRLRLCGRAAAAVGNISGAGHRPRGRPARRQAIVQFTRAQLTTGGRHIKQFTVVRSAHRTRPRSFQRPAMGQRSEADSTVRGQGVMGVMTFRARNGRARESRSRCAWSEPTEGRRLVELRQRGRDAPPDEPADVRAK